MALDPNFAEAHAIIGLAKIVIGRFEETEAHIQEAMRLSPRDRNLYSWLVIAGIAKLYLGSDDKAVKCFRRSIEINRNHPGAQYYLAGALALLGRLEEARCGGSSGYGASTQTSPSRASAPAQQVTIRAIWPRVSVLCHGMRKAGVPEG